MPDIRSWLLIFTLSASSAITAQDADSLWVDDPALSSEDSLSIFTLIDSLLNMDVQLPSQLALRVGYNSNVLSAGRTLGIKNFGLSPGISYYHKTGLYADVSSFWSNDFEPSYYLTLASIGYMHNFSKKVSILAGYDRYFYNTSNDHDYIPYKNAISIGPLIEFKPFTVTLNYSFYFGEQLAHRLMPGLGLTLEKRKLWGIDRVALLPAVYMLWGTEQITTLEYVAPKNLLEALRNFEKYGMRYSIVQTTENVNGIMNYAFSFPLSVHHKNWNFLFTYGYYIPKALAGEPLTISESSFLTASLTYFIDLSRNKKPL